MQVLYEDNHLLVINKPAGLVTQGAGAGQESVVTRAADYLKKKYSKPGNVFVGVVNRLDALVTGVLVLARTSKAASRLSREFREQNPEKIYLGLVAGRLSPASGELQDWLLKNETRRRVECVDPDRPGAKQAVLKYKLLESWNGQRLRLADRQSLIEICLVTGRKHQIRVQLASRGAPLLGDAKYGSRAPFSRGIALHCQRMSVKHPTRDEVLVFEAAVPKYWPLPGKS